MKKYSDVISGAILFVLSAVYFTMALDIKQYNAGQPGIITSDFIPKVYGVAVMVLSAILIFRGLREARRSSGTGAEQAAGRRFPIQPEIPLVFLLLIAYVALLSTVGFVIMSILFVVGLSCVLLPKDKRSVKTYVLILGVAVVFTVLITLIFIKGFSLTLPMGILG